MQLSPSICVFSSAFIRLSPFTCWSSTHCGKLPTCAAAHCSDPPSFVWNSSVEPKKFLKMPNVSGGILTEIGVKGLKTIKKFLNKSWNKLIHQTTMTYKATVLWKDNRHLQHRAGHFLNWGLFVPVRCVKYSTATALRQRTTWSVRFWAEVLLHPFRPVYFSQTNGCCKAVKTLIECLSGDWNVEAISHPL